MEGEGDGECDGAASEAVRPVPAARGGGREDGDASGNQLEALVPSAWAEGEAGRGTMLGHGQCRQQRLEERVKLLRQQDEEEKEREREWGTGRVQGCASEGPVAASEAVAATADCGAEGEGEGGRAVGGERGADFSKALSALLLQVSEKQQQGNVQVRQQQRLWRRCQLQ